MARHEMGSTASHEDDGPSKRGTRANIAVDVFLVAELRTGMSPFEPRG
jgi:hypothetical protein